MRLLILFPLMLMTVAIAQDKAREVGLKVGETVPDFSLRDQTGELRFIKDLVGPKGAVIDFYRSADW